MQWKENNEGSIGKIRVPWQSLDLVKVATQLEPTNPPTNARSETDSGNGAVVNLDQWNSGALMIKLKTETMMDLRTSLVMDQLINLLMRSTVDSRT